MLEGIESFVGEILSFTNAYKNEIHALVPIATIASLYMNWTNSSHLRKQANLQRRIETNRYLLDLFNSSNAAYNDYIYNTAANMVKFDGKYNTDEGLRSLNIALTKVQQCTFIFNPKDTSSLYKCEKNLLELIDYLVEIRDLQKKHNEYYFESLQHIGESQDKFNDLNHKISRINDTITDYKIEFNEKGEEYTYNIDKSATEMKERLFIPNIDVFAEEPSLICIIFSYFKTIKKGK